MAVNKRTIAVGITGASGALYATRTMAALAWLQPLGSIYLGGVVMVAALLIYEQSLVSENDLSQVKRAFDLNGWVGILYFVTTGLALYVG